MLKKRIKLEGMDKDYKLTIALVSKDEILKIASNPVGACFINDVAYFADLSDDCIAHECLHITFEHIRKTNLGESLGDLLCCENIRERNIGEEGVVFTFTDIYTQVKETLIELHGKQRSREKGYQPNLAIGNIIPPKGGTGTVYTKEAE